MPTTNHPQIPVTYVIDKNGIVRATFADTDYRRGAEPKAIVTALSKL